MMLPKWWPADKPYQMRDCIEGMRELPGDSIDMVMMDPVWPGCTAKLMGMDRAEELFKDVMGEVGRITKRLVVHLGCDTDPRLLRYVPTDLEFRRVFWLEYVTPTHKGRILYTSDVAYLFGELPKRLGKLRVIPGRCVDASRGGREARHPCPRKINHVKYLVEKCTNPGEIVLDPFLGSGTTLLACRETGRVGLGFEINKEYEKMIHERSMENIPRVEEYF